MAGYVPATLLCVDVKITSFD